MDGNNPLIGDDIISEEERLKQERNIRMAGHKPNILSPEESDDLNDDIRGDNAPPQEISIDPSDKILPRINTNAMRGYEI